jgi:predicted histidine transporter YuiF (NhaC family)
MARSVQLAKVAGQAELLRLRRRGRRIAVRAGFGVVATVFLLGALAAAHVAGAIELSQYVAPVWAVLIIAAIDLVIAIVLGILASRSAPDRIEREAQQVSEEARSQLMELATFTSLIGPALRMLGGRKTYGLALAALTARYLGSRR